MAKVYEVRFDITPNIPTRIVEEEKSVDIDIHVYVTGSYTYKVDNIDLFVKTGIDINDDTKRTEFEARLTESIRCSLRLAWKEKNLGGIKFNEINKLVEMVIPEATSDCTGSFFRLYGVMVESLSITSVRVEPADVIEYQKQAGIRVAEEVKAEEAKKAEEQAPKIQAPIRKKPLKWVCICGLANDGNFCPGCGRKKESSSKWLCECRTINKGKFCVNCGIMKI